MLEPRRDTGIFQINPPTPYIHYLPSSAPRGRVLVIHGLDASKEFMRIISAALADGGFDVYDIDLPGHGDSPAGFEAQLAQQAIRNAMNEIGGRDVIVLAHSLGAGLLLDLTAEQHFSTLVLLSPPPTPLARILANRILVVSPSFDVPRIKAFAPILADISEERLELWRITWAAHSSALFNPAYVRRIVEWLGGDGRSTRTRARLVWISAMLISGVVLGITLMPARDLKHGNAHIPTVLVRYVASCGMALFILTIVIPLAWLRLFRTDYLVSFLFLTGLALWFQKRTPLRINSVTILKAAGAAIFVIIVLGVFAGSHMLHMALSNGRWWRFPVIALAGLPLFIVDESTIRRIYPRWKSIVVAIVTRALLWAFLMTGVLLLNRSDAFLVLIAPLLVLFWILLWFASGVVHRHTQDPLATAVFAAIVQGWAFAAWFVTI
ncbi:MAG TPA: alpha/beta fold hydrolase [Terriglobia bacterium]|nr:alpha/beta fold hydrolase [Terriglobia bacterium]